jgi:hypothetical protein
MQNNCVVSHKNGGYVKCNFLNCDVPITSKDSSKLFASISDGLYAKMDLLKVPSQTTFRKINSIVNHS